MANKSVSQVANFGDVAKPIVFNKLAFFSGGRKVFLKNDEKSRPASLYFIDDKWFTAFAGGANGTRTTPGRL